ncbi:MAG: DNA-processing protein DprA [Planctomycetaceae bacterium]|nr:DNA-processing protein DprA [Planctomycetaceae bacterium]
MEKDETITNENAHSPGIALWLKLIRAEGIGPILFKRLLESHGTVERILGASIAELTRTEGIGQRTAERIARSCDSFDAQKELAFADKLGISIIHLNDNRYPPPLKAIYDPPPVLYVKGVLERADNLALAIVGSRQCSHYGSEQANRFAHLLAASGFTIVSGLARGIDSAAHQGALAAKGRTIAVQGCGLARVFPPENEKLFRQITENGAVVSELPLAYEPLSENFPGRNRIIAGLSLGVLVIEATLRSGALISAQAALENNREVMAIPGRIDSPGSTGCHKLIKEGARLIDGIEDVMDALGHIGQGIKQHVSDRSQETVEQVQAGLFDQLQSKFSLEERNVLAVVNSDPIHLEEIIGSTQLNAGKVHAVLIQLQLKGCVRQLPGSMFVKRAPAPTN